MGAASTDEEKALETPPHPLPAEEDPWDDEDFEIHTLMRDESPAQRRRDRVGFTVGTKTTHPPLNNVDFDSFILSLFRRPFSFLFPLFFFPNVSSFSLSLSQHNVASLSLLLK